METDESGDGRDDARHRSAGAGAGHDVTGAGDETIADVVADLRASGIRRVHVLAWRDLEDPDAGGSERHADEFMTRFAAAGLDIVHRTSGAAALPATVDRNGYRVIRRGNRFSVYPRTVAAEISRSMGRYDALIEVLNGVPWCSPLWCRRPRLTFLHHVHGPMWDQILSAAWAGLGRRLETDLAPRVYRRERVVTPSESTREALIDLGFRPHNVVSVPNGVEPNFTPGGTRSPAPLVVAVARLAPVKRFQLLIHSAVEARESVPDLQLVIVGDGPEREHLENLIAHHRAHDWITLCGHIEHDGLVDLYRSAWLVASASLAEGWGLSLTEAAGCGTPAVATDIRGHRSSVVHGETGLLASSLELGAAMAKVLLDDDLRDRLGKAAERRARTLTWEASALGIGQQLREVVGRS